MRLFLFFLSFYFNLFSQENMTNIYFNEIVSKTEFNNETSINKWDKDLKIFVCDVVDDSLYSKNKDSDVITLKTELLLIINELNTYINTVSIKVVEDCDSANFFIYLGSESWYNKSVPKSVNYTKNNLGLFMVSKLGSIIYKGSMYVDLYRTETILEKKHLLREELTQSLGLFNDSWEYPESIFYQGWSDVTEYSNIDKEIIKQLYR
jgi:hypothetical protein